MTQMFRLSGVCNKVFKFSNKYFATSSTQHSSALLTGIRKGMVKDDIFALLFLYFMLMMSLFLTHKLKKFNISAKCAPEFSPNCKKVVTWKKHQWFSEKEFITETKQNSCAWLIFHKIIELSLSISLINLLIYHAILKVGISLIIVLNLSLREDCFWVWIEL